MSPSKNPRTPPGEADSPKGGFYARHFTAIEAGDLGGALTAGVTDEIAMLKVAIRRVFAEMDGEGPELTKTLEALSSAAARLAGLVKLEQAMGTRSQDVAHALSQALDDVLKELSHGSMQQPDLPGI